MRLKRKKDLKTERLAARATLKQLYKIQQKANIYTEGNVSEYIVFAALNFVPSKDDLEKGEE